MPRRARRKPTASAVEKPDFEGAKYVYTPPPRAKENQEHLWNAVRTDKLSAISTDHCAFLWDGQKSLGKDDFSKIPNGGPGLENRLHMIHEFGVRAGRISLNRMVELLATSPAKLFGLYPRKGTIAVGSDADIVVFDPEKQVTITAANQRSKTDYNLYEGTEVTGSPEVVLLRGHVLVENDELVASPSVSGGRVSAWYLGSVLPSASAFFTSTSIASPFSACTITRAPVSAATFIVLKSVSSLTISAPL